MTDAPLTTTTQLVKAHQRGDRSAVDELFARYVPMLRRWATGRLPHYGRDLSDTEDLVQLAFLRAFRRFDKFEADQPGAFLAYLRSILMNLVRDEFRRKKVRPNAHSLIDTLPGNAMSQVEAIAGAETLANYEQALAKLDAEKRHAVIMRVEFEMTYDEIARELERPSANAVRMMIARALLTISEDMSV